MKKLFIVQKMVMADTVEDAIRLERRAHVVSVFLDEEWKKNNLSAEDLRKKK